MAQPMPGPQGSLSLHRRCPHSRCTVNPSEKVPGCTQWRHWLGRAPGLYVPVLDAHLSHTHHLGERGGGGLASRGPGHCSSRAGLEPSRPGPTAAKRWPPPACSMPRPPMGAGRGGWRPCGVCLLHAGTQLLVTLRTLVWSLVLVTDEEETEGLRGWAI